MPFETRIFRDDIYIVRSLVFIPTELPGISVFEIDRYSDIALIKLGKNSFSANLNDINYVVFR